MVGSISNYSWSLQNWPRGCIVDANLQLHDISNFNFCHLQCNQTAVDVSKTTGLSWNTNLFKDKKKKKNNNNHHFDSSFAFFSANSRGFRSKQKRWCIFATNKFVPPVNPHPVCWWPEAVAGSSKVWKFSHCSQDEIIQKFPWNLKRPKKSPTWWFNSWPFWDGEFTWPFQGVKWPPTFGGWSLGTNWITWKVTVRPLGILAHRTSEDSWGVSQKVSDWISKE